MNFFCKCDHFGYEAEEEFGPRLKDIKRYKITIEMQDDEDLATVSKGVGMVRNRDIDGFKSLREKIMSETEEHAASAKRHVYDNDKSVDNKSFLQRLGGLITFKVFQYGHET